MRLVWKRLNGGEPDHELVFGVLFVPLFGLATMLVVRFAPRSLIPPCLFHALTGIPCPTCGSYRSVALLAGGHVREAWLMQPLAVSLLALGMIYAVYAGVVVGLKLPRLRVEGWRARHTWRVLGALGILGLLNWAWLVAVELGWAPLWVL
ncbi:MAG: DUF2752 domain-containing protein [Kiritimatiellae bacterium]|nr:DUF2752 domain-containing protein [Kiritimatiellia bacterium]